MKIVAVVGARKRGNTEEVVSYFEKCLSKNAELETLNLSDVNIPYCTGCHACIFRGEEHCPHRDVVGPIEDAMMRADAVVLATPGYMFSVTGVMKAFLDHVAYNCHRPKYFGKYIYLLANCTKYQTTGVFTPLETWAGGAGFTFVGKTHVEMLPFPLKESELDKTRKKLASAAHELTDAVTSGRRRKIGFGDLMVFHAFRTLCDIAPNILQADRRYFEKRHAYDKGTAWYVPARVPRLRSALARMLEKRIRKGVLKVVDQEKLQEHTGRYKNRL